MLYVETNFIFGYATGRHIGYEQVLRQASMIAIPEICLMEAITTFKVDGNSQIDFVYRARQQRGAIRNTKHTPAARDFERTIDAAILDYEKIRIDREERLFEALEILRTEATLLSSSQHWFANRRRRGDLIADPTDELIAASILEDRRKRDSDDISVFLSEDQVFHKQPVLGSFNAANVNVTRRVEYAIEYVESHRQ